MIFILLTRPDKPFDEYTEFDLLKIYSRCLTFKDSAKLVNVSRQAFTEKWYQEGLPSPVVTKNYINTSDKPIHRIAVVSDLHWGNIYQCKTVFDNFIQDCKDQEISTLINLGDSTEGLMARPNHEYSRFLHSIPEYEDYFLSNYPVFENNILINGNHDVSLQKYRTNYNFAREMAAERCDITYAKQGSVIEGPGRIKFCLHHGSGSCESIDQSRNKRMKTRALQLMSEGSLAPIILLGHCHRISVLENFMNSTIIGTGCFCAPDQVTIKRFGGVDIAGLILSYQVNEVGQPVNLKLDWRFAKEYGGAIIHDY